MLHVPAHDKAPHVTCSIRQAYQRQQEEPDSCWSPGKSEATVHQAFLSSLLGIRVRRTSYETILVMHTESCYRFLHITAFKRLAKVLDETLGPKPS
jgi:hypothetical protein